MKKNIKFVVYAFILSVIVISVRDMFFVNDHVLQIYGEKNTSFVKSSNGAVILFGKKSQTTEAIRRAISPYFSPKETLYIDQYLTPQDFQGRGFVVQIFSSNFARGTFDDTRVFFIGKPEKEEETNLKLQPTSFDSDFWILKKTYIPDFLPPPKKAILYIGERKPAKSLRTFARKNNLPLVSYKETGGFVVSGKAGELMTR